MAVGSQEVAGPAADRHLYDGKADAVTGAFAGVPGPTQIQPAYVTTDDSHERIVHDSQRELARTRSHEPEFIGLPEPDVRQLTAELGLDLRLIGPGDAITLGLRPRRMTVVIAEGVAIKAFGG